MTTQEGNSDGPSGGEEQNKITKTVKQLIKRNGGFVVGGFFGWLAANYWRFTARAAFDVRPNLADVGFLQAAVTSHGHDWLYYNYPTEMTVISVVLAGLVFGIGWWTV